MATREFDSVYVNDLATTALIGLDVYINQEWEKECKKYYHPEPYTRWERFSHRLWTGRKPESDPAFDQYVEERKLVLYSEYSDTYTLWRNHTDRWIKIRALIERIRILSEENQQASKMTRLDDSEYTTLRNYAEDAK